MSCAVAYLYHASKPVMFSGNLQILALRSFKEMKASCINSVLKLLTLTSNEEGSRFLLKSYSFVREIKAYFLNLCTSLEGGEVMNRLVCFLIVGLAVIALQATTVEAQGGDPNMPPPTGAPGAPPTGDPNMPPPTGAPGTPPMGDAAGK